MIIKIIIPVILLCMYCHPLQAQDIFIKKFTNINPVSYTDVVYTGNKDTVLVSTYSGRIAKVINGVFREKVVAKLDDEIYALAYHNKRKEIAAATLENGIVLIDETKGNPFKKLSLHATWATSVFYSDDNYYLVTYDQNGRNYIWAVEEGYREVKLAADFPKGRIVKIDTLGRATIASAKKIFLWNLKTQQVVKEWDVELARFGDMDDRGNFLSIDYNECGLYDANKKTFLFKVKHPNWLLPNIENEDEVFEIPYNMQLTSAKFALSKIYTASIDRSIRVWDKNSGELISTLTGHKGSISKMKVSNDQKQVVSVDLKGVIRFWEVE
jgi:WD40 repeat protein